MLLVTSILTSPQAGLNHPSNTIHERKPQTVHWSCIDEREHTDSDTTTALGGDSGKSGAGGDFFLGGGGG